MHFFSSRLFRRFYEFKVLFYTNFKSFDFFSFYSSMFIDTGISNFIMAKIHSKAIRIINKFFLSLRKLM